MTGVEVILKGLKALQLSKLNRGLKRAVAVLAVRRTPTGFRFTVSEAKTVDGKVVFEDVYYEVAEAAVRETGRRETPFKR